MNIDKAPLHLLQESPGVEKYQLGTLKVSKADYANAEKTNELIDEICRELKEIKKQLNYLLEEENKRKPVINSKDLR